MDVPDALICQGHLANRSGVPEQAYHASIAASPERVLLLSTQGTHTLANTYFDVVLLLHVSTKSLIQGFAHVSRMAATVTRL